MGARHSRLAAALAAAWEAEVVAGQQLTRYADRLSEPQSRARLRKAASSPLTSRAGRDTVSGVAFLRAIDAAIVGPEN